MPFLWVEKRIHHGCELPACRLRLPDEEEGECPELILDQPSDIPTLRLNPEAEFTASVDLRPLGRMDLWKDEDEVHPHLHPSKLPYRYHVRSL